MYRTSGATITIAKSVEGKYFKNESYKIMVSPDLDKMKANLSNTVTIFISFNEDFRAITVFECLLSHAIFMNGESAKMT